MHIPVLLQTICQFLALRSGDNVIDATAGEGGYSREFIKAVVPRGKVLMIDWDNQAITLLRRNFGNELESGQCLLRQGNFKDIKAMASGVGFDRVRGIVFDFGTSRLTLKNFGKGFSFSQDEPLIMAYSPDVPENAAEVVNHYPEKELKRIFSEYGEERFSGRIARHIAEYRAKKKINTTKELAEIISQAVPPRHYQRIHPATKVFQALRIYVNKELDNIAAALPQAMELLAPKGRLVAVSYHSLEDRIVKNAFRDFEKAGLGQILTKGPVIPTPEEIMNNPSARSAKLRAIEKQ